MSKRALISVSDKSNIVSLAQALIQLNYQIISTGGTLELLKASDIPAQSVEEVTGFPEILDGRVKTLHPAIHGGLLAKQDCPDHQHQLTEHQIQAIDLVITNLYPFKQTFEQEAVSEADMIENIDIGGPTMLRAAAKNYQSVTVVVDPADYSYLLVNLKNNTLDKAKRKQLAGKVFRHTAQYDALIADYFAKQNEEPFSENKTITFEKVQTLRYGENPHQQATFYKYPIDTPGSLVSAKQRHGKELSYNNIRDANSALDIVSEYTEPAAVAVKHMNPCGIGLGTTIEEAFDKAYAADTTSIFGGIVVLNRTVDDKVAQKLHDIFLEIIIAPSFTGAAFEILIQKKNIRLLEMDMTTHHEMYYEITGIRGGMLMQEADLKEVQIENLTYATHRKPTEEELTDLLFAFKAVKHVTSNAIILAKDKQTIGVGAGQMNRIGAANIAIEQAGEQARQAVMASDAFFPMPDTVEAAIEAGITAIIQPGGSKRDQESIERCNQHGIAMVLTHQRHFKH